MAGRRKPLVHHATARIPDVDIDEGLPDEEVAGMQAAYLESVLRAARGERRVNFSMKFRYDPYGTSHYRGQDFTLSVSYGACSVRRARMRHFQGDREKDARGAIVHPVDQESDMTYAAELEKPIMEVSGEDLRDCVAIFKITEQMLR